MWPMHFGSCLSPIHHHNDFNEKTWEGVVVGLGKYSYRWSLGRGVCTQKFSCYRTKWVDNCLISVYLFFFSFELINFLLTAISNSISRSVVAWHFKRNFVTFICGTDSPVNMASSTMQEPRSNTISHGIRKSEVLDLPASKQRKREKISLMKVLSRLITKKVEMWYFSVPMTCIHINFLSII